MNPKPLVGILPDYRFYHPVVLCGIGLKVLDLVSGLDQGYLREELCGKAGVVAYQKGWYHRRSGLQRQQCHPLVCTGRTTEEIRKNPFAPGHILVHEQPHHLFSVQALENIAKGLLFGNHFSAEAGPEQDHKALHGPEIKRPVNDTGGVFQLRPDDCQKFPVPEMSGQTQHAPALIIRLLNI